MKKLFLLFLMVLLKIIHINAYDCKFMGICYNLNNINKTATVTCSGYPYNNDYTGHYGGGALKGDLVIPQSISYDGVEYVVTAIDESAFWDAEVSIMISSVSIPNTVTTIGRHAFSKCKDLTSVNIPESVTSIGRGAFYECTALASIIVESGNPVYDSRDNCNAIIETSTNKLLVGCSNTIIPNGVTTIGASAFYDNHLTSITIPNGITTIEGWAFYSCRLATITIPKSVMTIEGSAFADCGLTSVTVENPTPIAIGSGVFTNSSNATLYVPAGSKAAYEAADYWKEFKEIVEMAPPFPTIESFAVVLDGEKQTIKGTLITHDNNDYIITDSNAYRIISRTERLAGDVNGDGKITIADVTALVNVILGHSSAESATIYHVERADKVIGIVNKSLIGWGGIDEDGSLDPDVKMQRQ